MTSYMESPLCNNFSVYVVFSLSVPCTKTSIFYD